jgi:hypothetical protein
MRKLMTIVSVLMLGLMAIAASTARAAVPVSLTEVCSDNIPVSANGSFNIDVTCPSGSVVATGGYSCSYNSGADLLPVIVSVNTFYGGYVGGPFPTGWQTTGQTLESAQVVGHTYACVETKSGKIENLVPYCTIGTNAKPCDRDDTCTDLSGQSSQPVYSNPTCQVCISCAELAG